MPGFIENEFVEFKESLSQLSRAAESIAAMLNKHSKATILFGVKDNGKPIELDIGNKTLKDISEALCSKIKPSIIPTIIEEEYDGKIIIKVMVVGHNKPYSADGKYLIRSGSENKKIDPEIMKELLFSSSIESMAEIESFDQELTFNQLKQLFILRGYSINDSSFAKNNGLLTKNHKYNLLANLLSDNNSFSIKVVRFAGTDKSEMISRNEYGYKCLVLALQSALNYVLSFNETRVELTGNAAREEKHLFDEKSLREAWSNACLHTRWDKMVPPAIYIFKDRIEIISTGGLPVDYSLDDFYQGISNPINKQLQKILGQLGIVEQTGHGVLEIIKNYGREAFNITDNHVVVTLKFPFELKNEGNDFSTLSSSQEKVLRAIITKPSITTDELIRVVGLGPSRISTIVKELKALNKIRRIGSNKTGYWEVIAND
mgnify:CR=1 FL=1